MIIRVQFKNLITLFTYLSFQILCCSEVQIIEPISPIRMAYTILNTLLPQHEILAQSFREDIVDKTISPIDLMRFAHLAVERAGKLNIELSEEILNLYKNMLSHVGNHDDHNYHKNSLSQAIDALIRAPRESDLPPFPQEVEFTQQFLNQILQMTTNLTVNSLQVNNDATIGGNLTVDSLGIGVVQSTSAGELFSSAGSNGQLLIGTGTLNSPVWADLTSSNSTIIITNGSGSIDLTTSGATANSFPTNAGTATPSADALTIAGGSNINTTGAGSTVTITLVNSPSVSGSLTAATGITATTGNITATAGNLTTTNGSHVVGSTAANATANNLNFLKSRSGGVITSGDTLGNIAFEGFDGTQYTIGSKIVSVSSGTIASTRVASDLEFFTHPDSTTVSTQRMIISSAGDVTINTPDSGTALTVNGASATSNVIKTTAGSVATPAITSTTDATTGLYYPASGQFALAASGVAKLQYDGASVSYGSALRFMAYNSVDQVFSSGASFPTLISFDTLVPNITSTSYNTTTSTYTVPASGSGAIAGVYRVSFTVFTVSNGANGIFSIDLYKNGSILGVPYEFSTVYLPQITGAIYVPLCTSWLVYLVPGDSIQLFGEATSNNVTVAGGRTSWSVDFFAF